MIVQSTLLKLLHKIYRKDKLTLELTKAISVQLYKVKQNIQEIDGVKVKTEQTDIYQITHVQILNETGSETMGKPIGNYITIESELLKENDKSRRNDESCCKSY